VDAVALGDAHDHRAATLQPRRLQLRGPGRDDLRQHQPISLRSFTLGSTPYVTPVDPLWGNTPAPYGPFFLFLDGKIDWISQHHELWTVVGLRLLETFAVAMIGYGVVMLARGLDRDPGEAFVLSAMNPLVLLTLIGGAHNDAIMAGFLVVGIALAVKKHPIWALFFCSCAAAIKAPAAIGLAFVAWTWLGPKASIRDRLRPIAIAGLVAAATLGVWTWLAGFGFGWVGNLLSNGTVRSWAAPATALGLALTNTLHAVGFHGVEVGSVLSVTRSSDCWWRPASRSGCCGTPKSGAGCVPWRSR